MPTAPETGPDRLLNSCPSCSEILDVTDLEPYAKISCPHCGNPIRIRQKFDEFIITGQIGEGGMSRVFRARDTLLNREVALKILNEEFSQDETRIAQFEKEARITASFSHPNVVKVFKVGRDQGFFYIAMELVGGGSLEADIKAQNRLPEDRILEIAAQVSQGLRAAMRAGLIHRDIKPGNILFTSDGTAKIVDFGLSLIHGKEVDTSGEIWATPFYVPPEQLFDQPEDFRGDIYSLGASLFHALAGRPPYDADTNSLEKLRKIKSKPVHLASAAPQVSWKTREVIDRTLALKPDNRYHDYDSLLEAISDARSLLRNPAIRLARRITSTRRRRVALIAGFASLCAVLTAILFIVARGEESVDAPNAPGDPAVSGSGVTLGTGDRTASDVFLSAREALFSGNVQKATEEFELLLAPDANTRQPTKNWSRFNAALCYLIAGNPQDARSQFRILRDESRFSDAESDAPLCSFFENVGEALSGADLPTPQSISHFTNRGSGALALLASGLAHWHAGDPDHAVAFFNLFNGSSPGEKDPWPTEYQDLTKPYLQDFALVSSLPDSPPDSTLADAVTARTSVATAALALRTSGAMRRILQGRLAALDSQIAKLEREAELAAREQIEKARRDEVDAFLALVRSLEPFRVSGDFTAAQNILRSTNFQNPEIQATLDDQVYLWQTAEEFLNQLVRDLNERVYEGPIQRSTGPPITGAVAAASRTEIRIRIGAGETRVSMADVPPSGLVEIASSIADSIPDSTAHYRRQELIVVYARVTNLTAIAQSQGDQLMSENRAFRTRWSRILEADSAAF